MAHKDWKGPGVYNCWDEHGVWKYKGVKSSRESLSWSDTYRKCEYFELPELPKSELEDGVYWVIDRHNGYCVWSLVDGWWRDESGVSKCKKGEDEPSKVLGRIPIEPID